MECLYLGYETARWYWEHAKGGASTLRSRPTRSTLTNYVKTPTAARKIAQGTLFENMDLHVMAATTFSRHGSNVSFHLNGGNFPKGSFVQLSNEIYIASPLLSFVQTAQTSTFGQTFLYGSMLCGSYAYDEAQERGIVGRKSLTSANQIKKYCQACSNLHGVKAARKVAAHMVDGSASPREGMLFATLTLPKHQGGWGLPRAEMNQRIDIPQRLAWPGQRKFFVADLFWPEAKVTLEYDSDIEHAHKMGIYRDSVKRNTLIDMGYTPICVTSVQLNNPKELSYVADMLRRALGKRRQPLPSDFFSLQKKLRSELGLSKFEHL